MICPAVNTNVRVNCFYSFIMKKILTVENLHLFTGSVLILSGILSYFQDGFTMMLSWCIFGAMYISMSDIGEHDMCCETKASQKHKVRTFAAYFGSVLSLLLLTTFI